MFLIALVGLNGSAKTKASAIDTNKGSLRNPAGLEELRRNEGELAVNVVVLPKRYEVVRIVNKAVRKRDSRMRVKTMVG
jgi:hypothetical protein